MDGEGILFLLSTTAWCRSHRRRPAPERGDSKREDVAVTMAFGATACAVFWWPRVRSDVCAARARMEHLDGFRRPRFRFLETQDEYFNYPAKLYRRRERRCTAAGASMA